MSRIRTLVATGFLTTGALLAFVALAFGLQRFLGQDSPVRLDPVTALLFAAMPAVVWLGYFRSQDRHEPEPKTRLLGACLLGALVAGPASSLVIEIASAPGEIKLGLQTLSLSRMVYALAVVGVAQECCKYLVIRYTLYRSPQFDNTLDGLTVMAVTGVGFASYLTYRSLLANGGEIYLGAAAAQAVVTALKHASYACVLGYAMGRAKRARGASMLPLAAGVLAAAICSGSLGLILGDADELVNLPWPRIALGLGLAGSLVVLTLLLIRSRLPSLQAASTPSQDRRTAGFLLRSDVGVLVLALALVAGGSSVARSLRTRVVVSLASGELRLSRPSGWLSVSTKDAPLGPLLRRLGTDIPASPDSKPRHSILMSPADARRRLEVRVETRPAYTNLRGALAVQKLAQYGEQYWQRSISPVSLNRHEWIRTEFRYRSDSVPGASPQTADAVEYATVHDGHLYTVTLHDGTGLLPELESLLVPGLRLESAQSTSRAAEEAPQ